LFFSDDLEMRAKLRGYMTAYNFVLFRDWMGINRLRMTSARDKSKTTLRFCIWLLVKTFPGASEPAFKFHAVEELEALGIDVSTDDVLHNVVTMETQLMKESTPWRGAREKDPLLIQMLIE